MSFLYLPLTAVLGYGIKGIRSRVALTQLIGIAVIACKEALVVAKLPSVGSRSLHILRLLQVGRQVGINIHLLMLVSKGTPTGAIPSK